MVVFADDGDFDRLLAPYNEADESYFVFHPVEEQQIRAKFAKFKVNNPGWDYDLYLKEFGYIQENGQWGYRSNPNGFWDWYTLDGKDYLFDLKEGVDVSEKDCYQKQDYNWMDEDEVLGESAIQFWNRYIATTKNGPPPSLFTREYYLERYKTREQYAHEHSRTVPFAFITPDGVWHAPGRMGWFACSDESAEDWIRYEKEWFDYIAVNDNPYVSIVDCHI